MRIQWIKITQQLKWAKILLGVFSLFTVNTHAGTSSNSLYNVLFIISDDLSATALNCYGNDRVSTPNIDRLANEGTRFTRTYCQYPVCEPSRASLLSGYYPHAINIPRARKGIKNSLRESIGERATLPQHFKNNGYKSARISKLYHMRVPGDIEQGTSGKDDETSWTEYYNIKAPEVFGRGESELLENNPDGSKGVIGGNTMELLKSEGGDLSQADGKTAQKASEWIRANKDRPFFLAVGFVRPHVPFAAPKEYFERYKPEDMLLPHKFPGDWDDIPKGGINYKTTQNLNMNLEQQRKSVAGYYASVSYMDAQVGKILNTLRDEGLEKNTIVVFTSDHGFFLGEHDFWMKVGVMEESARVPLIIKIPGKAPALSHSFTELVDLYPTLAEACSLEVPERLQGHSLLPLLSNPALSVRDTAFCSSRGLLLLRNDRWAYMQHGEEKNAAVQLYDMHKDAQQWNNLSDSPEHAPVVERFRQQMAQKIAKIRTNDLGLNYTTKKK
ncbi:MAG: sulfatase [Opitutales bacterium]